ncbi:hypothetical protein M2451_001117 [Dysgonomonas sp. PFB1-18]|uniref:hypothetical protein n=1 Tax=unclassified Dysgonomonas TaxID=2630389 RepID=UPI002472F643|nr:MULTISPECIES: hypothetical protein [unclassified Dysgonomonas]MDH6308258.1 hypothetical protein [Dysgonomonas sp. PF1-14]MDH6338303.1 hypothetical protein [Dysgonomonas sp. PF1-16]MDH6379800.1 hypothetical protein [Dysgonomonas sp. PFB1-18]MDH6397110.1 hypothetical protein [Dysgonomonas sp. PF1-23]
MKKLLYLSICILSVISISCNSQSKDQAEIIEVFNTVNTAASQRNGQVIYNNLTTEAIKYYEAMLVKVNDRNISGTITDKMNMTTALILFSREELKNMDAKSFIISLYDNSIVDEEKQNAINAAKLGSIKITGDDAVAALGPMDAIDFKKEDGKWKFNILSLLRPSNRLFGQFKTDNNLSDKDIIEAFLLSNEALMKNTKLPVDSILPLL